MTRRDYERTIARMAKRIVSLEKKNEKLKTLCTKLEEENIELGEKLIWQEEYHKEELAEISAKRR